MNTNANMSNIKKVPKLHELYGQDKAKRTLNFHIEAYKKDGFFPPSLFVAEKGGGKTTFADAVAEDLFPAGVKVRKPKIPVNCSQLKNVRQFIQSICIPHIAKGTDMTIIFDECSELPRDIQMLFLSILQINHHKYNSIWFEDQQFEFDFRKLTFIFCTTDPQKLVKPLIDRLERFDFEAYTNPELQQMLEARVNIPIDKDALKDITTVIRGNPRAVIKLTNNIQKYLDMRPNVPSFTMAEWTTLRHTLGINDHGLSNLEIQYLKYLAGKTGPTRLNSIAAKLGMTSGALQRDLEIFLCRLDLIAVTMSGREITNKGRKAVKNYLDSVGTTN